MMSWFSNLFHKEDPAAAGDKYLQQIPGAMNPYFQPYIQQGQEAGNKLNSQYDQMTSNPGDFYNKISEGYQPSAGYQFKLQQALNAGKNASARGGMAGTPQDQQQQMQVSNDISSQDFEQYLNHILGIFGMGQQGQQGQQKQGFDASTTYGQNLGDILGRRGQLAFEGAAGRNANRANTLENYTQLVAQLLGGPLGERGYDWLFPGQQGGK